MLGREALFATSPLDAAERNAVFDALASLCVWTPVYYLWRPNLPDPGDDHLIELAIAGGADWIVTANLRDVARGELRMERPQVGTAAAFLQTWETTS